jgi:hypothetical protein
MSNKVIVLDANILIRAVLGRRVQFFAPDVAYADARKYLPALLELGVKDPWSLLHLQHSFCLRSF